MSGHKLPLDPENGFPLDILKPVRCCCEVGGNYYDPSPFCPVHGVKMNRRAIPDPESPKHYRPVTCGGASDFHA